MNPNSSLSDSVVNYLNVKQLFKADISLRHSLLHAELSSSLDILSNNEFFLKLSIEDKNLLNVVANWGSSILS